MPRASSAVRWSGVICALSRWRSVEDCGRRAAGLEVEFTDIDCIELGF
jgi:hypothetical protein